MKRVVCEVREAGEGKVHAVLKAMVRNLSFILSKMGSHQRNVLSRNSIYISEKDYSGCCVQNKVQKNKCTNKPQKEEATRNYI